MVKSEFNHQTHLEPITVYQFYIILVNRPFKLHNINFIFIVF